MSWNPRRRLRARADAWLSRNNWMAGARPNNMPLASAIARP